jgi:hypothetical protein
MIAQINVCARRITLIEHTDALDEKKKRGRPCSTPAPL